MPATRADILALAKAGFTAKQIASILGDDAVGKTPEHVLMPDVKKLNEPVPGPGPEPTPTPDPKNTDTDVSKILIDSMNAKFDQMLRLMQQQNVMGMQIPKQETADDVLASIINPPGSEE